MRIRAWGRLAGIAVLAGGAIVATQAEAPIHGRFLVRYQPIYCRMAPCGRGSYTVEMAGRRIATVKQVAVDATTSAQQRRFIAGFPWGYEPLAIDGSATISDDHVTLHANRAIEGEWKP